MQSSSTEQLNEIKTQLITREGIYRLIPAAEYYRPKSNAYAPNTTLGNVSTNSTPCRISFTKVCMSQHNNRNTSPSASDGPNSGFHSMIGPTTSIQPATNYNRLNHSSESLEKCVSNSNVATSTISSSYSNKNHIMGLNIDSNSLPKTNNKSEDDLQIDERICFNVGREIYMFSFLGIKPADLTKLADRRSYKATCPTCHDIHSNIENREATLLIGFNAGQIQLIDLYRTDVNKFFNQERLIDKTKTTCIRWLPRSRSNFLVSYSSGQMYLFKEDIPCGNTAPNYQQFKSGEGFTIYTCKSKTTRNPIFRWSIGEGAIHEFAFSPCGEYLAIVSQDGFLRVFHYDHMELIGRMRSYFGGLLCVGWSPDSRFIVTGGEDDLITVWSLAEKRVIARGQGHKSWVNVVTFDSYMTIYKDSVEEVVDNEFHIKENMINGDAHESFVHKNHENTNQIGIISYRIGSVGQDTQICLWDLTDDIIRQSNHQSAKSRTSLISMNKMSVNNIERDSNVIGSIQDDEHGSNNGQQQTDTKHTSRHSNGILSIVSSGSQSTSRSSHNFFKLKSKSESKSHKALSFSDKHIKQTTNSTSKNNASSNIFSNNGQTMVNCTGSLGANHHQSHPNNANICDPGRLLGTILCPKLDDVPMLEPHVCKKIAHERLTALAFHKDYFIVANQDGRVTVWGRPNKMNHMKITSPTASLASDVNELACDDIGSEII